jgi:hypothetical protein
MVIMEKEDEKGKTSDNYLYNNKTAFVSLSINFP